MSDAELLDKLNTVIMDQLDLDDLSLTRDTQAQDVDGWDSLAHVRIIIAVEQAFNVRLPTSQVTTIANVGELVDLIRSRV